MIKEKLSGGAFRHIEGELYFYHENKKELRDLKENRKRNRKRINHLQDITEVIHSIYKELPDEKKRLIRLLYWNKPQTLTWEGIARECHISKRQAQRWRKEIVEQVADKMGWR